MTSLFFGSTRTQAKSDPRPETRSSVFTRFHVVPASSERYTALGFPSTSAYMRLASLGAIPMPMRPSPSAGVGSPPVSCDQVLPPSVDLKRPLPAPLHSPFSQGPWRAAHNTV